MSPFVRLLGTGDPRDALAVGRARIDDENGAPRYLVVGDPEFHEVSGDELRRLVGSFEVEIRPDEPDSEPPPQDPPAAPAGSFASFTPQPSDPPSETGDE